MITHYGIICNVVQIGKYLNLNDSRVHVERKMYRPGSVSLASSLRFPLVPRCFADSELLSSCTLLPCVSKVDIPNIG